MSKFNDSIKNVHVIEFFVVIISFYLLWFFIKTYFCSVSGNVVYVAIILYFAFKLRNHLTELKTDFLNILSKVSFQYILLIIVLNIFFSYGMLYFANFLNAVPIVNQIMNFSFSSMSLFGGLGSLLAIVLISPVSEELIFRGIFLNKLRLIVPTIFAVLISSLLFGALHSFGSIFSAFIFSMSVSVIYLKTDNILVPIFAHFLNNVIAESIVHIDSGNILFTNDIVVCAMSVLAIISLVILSVLIYLELINYK